MTCVDCKWHELSFDLYGNVDNCNCSSEWACPTDHGDYCPNVINEPGDARECGGFTHVDG